VQAKEYTLFTGRVLDRKHEPNSRTPHYQILLAGAGELFRVAVNTRSGTSRQRRADLLYFADDDFRHAITRRLANVPDGSLAVSSHPGGLALDYQRGGMFDRRHMRRIPSSRPGPRNDLMDELDYRVERAMADTTIRLHAFGSRWGPELHLADQVFDFTPGNGIHDVHMNQGNWDEHWHDNRIWADGGLIFEEPEESRWSAIFLAFQTQSWHTDGEGNPIPRVVRHDGALPREAWDRHAARIVGAYVHPNEQKTGVENVTIRNDRSEPLDVNGWRLLSRDDEAAVLHGEIPPHRSRRFALPAAMQLSSRGGLIRLLDEAGHEVDGVSYTRHEARRKHGKLTFAHRGSET
jgi:uncharacterized protein YukJ